MPRPLKESVLSVGITRKAQIDNSNVNKEERKVPLLIATQTPLRVKKYDRWGDLIEYDEVLLLDQENIDLTRAANAKLRWMHGDGQYGELPLGKLENVTAKNQELRATAIFSKANPHAEMFWEMVQEGTLSEVSVGGIKKDIRITERDGDVPLVEVTLWEFTEASLVDIGADPSAGVNRNFKQGDQMTLEELRAQLDELKRKKAPEDDIKKVNDQIEAELKRVQAENKELKRVAALESLARSYNADSDFLKPFIEDKNKTTEDLARALLDNKQKEDKPVTAFASNTGRESDIKRAAADALILRSGISLATPHNGAKEFMGASFSDIIRAVTGYTGFDKNEMIKRALSTSDFPVLLGNVANRVLVAEFEQAEGTFKQWTSSTELPDFKTRQEVSRSTLSGRMKKITEYGESKKAETKESAESWRLYSYGSSVKLSREMIINDDLAAFMDLIKDFALMANRTANGTVYDLLQGKGEFASYKMADGKTIFDATHNNLSASGTTLDTNSMSKARTQMRRQKDAAGSALNINPNFLLVAPELETTAYQLLNSEADITASNANAGKANPFKNSLTPIVDAELDANPWYLASNRRTIKVGYLAGTNGLPIVEEKERNLRFVEFEAVFDFGVVAEDFRGLYKNAGSN